MAPKRPSPMEEPPSASSSSEEEQSDEEQQHQRRRQQQQQEASDDGEGEEEGSDNEEEEGSEDEEESEDEQPQKKQQPNKISSPPPKKSEHQQQKQQPPQQQQNKKKPEPETESEDESGSETESDSDPEPVSASKPVEDTKKVSSDSVAKKPDPGKLGKRGGGEELEKEKNKDPKRSKKDGGGELIPTTPAMSSPGDVKKTLFQRLWTEDDEIAILKGILDFKEKKGIDATKDMGVFYEFVKKSLECDGTVAQMKDKISRLRRKFENGVKRGKEGENKKFGRAHDQLAFDLSKKIWGSESVSGTVKENGKANKKSLDALKMELGIGKERAGEKKKVVKFNKGLIRVGGMEEYVVKEGWDVIEPAKQAELEEKWTELHVEELELFLKRNELIREQAKLMLASYRAEDDED